MFQNTKLSFFLTNFELVFDFSTQNQLLAVAFLLITAITNLYAISLNRKFESLIGSLYCLSSLICLFLGDFISMIISLEFMTIFSSIIVFWGQLKMKPARQYFLTHLFSSSLILTGISLLISATNDSIFISLTEAVRNFELPAMLILTGCLINVSAIFFNGWVVNCYPTASGSGIIYLISFTTKVNLIIILKLFSGLEILKSFGLSMIVYGLIFALIEKNLKRIVCYLTISQLGFVLAAIAIPSPNIIFLVTSFIFIHILYNGLFVFYFSILEDRYQIKNYQDLKIAVSPLLLIGFIITVLIYLSILPISSSYIKLEMANALNEKYIMIFFKIATSIVLFGLVFEAGMMSLSQKWESSKKLLLSVDSRLRGNDILYFSSCTITLGICLFYPIPMSYVASSNMDSNLLIVTISLFLALILRKVPRILTENINLDLYQYIEKITYFSITKYKETKNNEIDEDEYLNLKSLWNNALNKLSSWHNQQTSIFIVILMLISLILVLYVIPAYAKMT
ncbi:MAG: proton-conducting transporter membrane subunit [Rickettsia endosymbiont of Argas persicus]